MNRGAIHNQALALAGAMHSCWLVRQLAREGHVDSGGLDCALGPVFVLDPPSVPAIYGSSGCWDAMLSVLRTQLDSGSGVRDIEVTRYTATLMHLERKLVRRRDLMDKLREDIEKARSQLDYFGLTHDSTVGRLAGIYSETVSTLRPQIMVQGNAAHLNDSRSANRIRALLLAAMRSIVLWRQCGGTRLRLIFQRNRLIRAASELAADRDRPAASEPSE